MEKTAASKKTLIRTVTFYIWESSMIPGMPRTLNLGTHISYTDPDIETLHVCSSPTLFIVIMLSQGSE